MAHRCVRSLQMWKGHVADGQMRPMLTSTDAAGVPWHTGVLRPLQVWKGHAADSPVRPVLTFTDEAGILRQVIRACHDRRSSLHGLAVEHGWAKWDAGWPWSLASCVQGERVAGAGGVEPDNREGQSQSITDETSIYHVPEPPTKTPFIDRCVGEEGVGREQISQTTYSAQDQLQVILLAQPVGRLAGKVGMGVEDGD